MSIYIRASQDFWYPQNIRKVNVEILEVYRDSEKEEDR